MNAEFVLSTQCVCLDEEGNAWIFSNEMNALFYRELESGITEYITGFGREAFWARALYTEAIWFQKKIFLIPCAAKDIAVYDTVREHIEYISLDTPPDNYNVVRLPGNRLLLYSVYARPTAYIVSLEKMDCEYIPIDYGEEKAVLEGTLLRGTAYCRGKACFVVDRTNQYVEFDTDTRTVRLCRTEKEVPLFHAASDGQRLYMMHDDGCAYDAYDESGYIKTYRLSEESGKTGNDFRFEDMEYVINTVLEDGNVISIPMKKQPITIMKNDIFVRFPLDNEKIGSYINDLQPLYICKCFQNKLILFPYHGDALVIIDLMTAETVYQNAKIDMGKYGRIFEDILGRQKGILHDSQISLEVFLHVVGQGVSGRVAECENVGTKIYEHMLEDEPKGREE